MRNFKDIIMEKLKVSKTSNAVQFETTLEDFIRAYFMIDKQHGLYSEVAYYSASNKAPLYSEERDQLNIEQANRRKK